MKIRNRIVKNSLNILFLFLLVILCLTGCGSNKVVSKEIQGIEVDCYTIHTNKQSKYLESNYDSISSYARGSEELSRPYSVKLTWDEKLGDSNYIVYISEKDDYSNSIIVNTSDKEVEIYNLKIKTIYYWKVTNTKTDDKYQEYIGKPIYIDEECIRNLYIDGVTNARDLGGWTNKNNVTTKQGLIYRSGKFNYDESTENCITSSGIETLVKTLGIKTELDLRTTSDNENGGIITSPLGEGVEYISFPMESNGNIMLLNRKKLKDLFAILGDESKYPLVFHCSIGTDRTGFVGFILNALLDVSDEDLYRDYLFSNFGDIGSQRTASVLEKNYFTYLEPYEGNSTKEKLITFLTKEGVDINDINNFIKMMTE